MPFASCVKKKILKLTMVGKWREEGKKGDNILLLLSLIK